jgi:ABC-type methionine transport system permease subunit
MSSPKTKIPGSINSIRGFPFFILKIYTQPLTAKALAKRLGRFSDSLALSAAFPSQQIRQWRTAAKRVPLSREEKRERLQRRARPRF